jgi:hypothetical protein
LRIATGSGAAPSAIPSRQDLKNRNDAYQANGDAD